MSLFDLQDVCIATGSLATLDLPMVVDLIEIYVLKGSYCTLTTTNWFFQELSVIPRGSWGDVARRFTMIRWATPNSAAPSSHNLTPSASSLAPPPSAPSCRDRTCSDQLDGEFPSVLNSSVLLMQADEGVLIPVVDLIDDLSPPTAQEKPTQETEQQALEAGQTEVEHQDQVDPIPSSPIDSGISIYSWDSDNNDERQVLYSSGLAIVKYTTQRANVEAGSDFAQAGPQPISSSTPTILDIISEFKSVKKVMASLESSISQMRDEQTYLKYDAEQFRKVYYRNMDDVLAIVSITQSALETILVNQIQESHQYFVAEMTSIRSKLAEMEISRKGVLTIYGIDNRRSQRNGEQLSRCQLPFHNGRILLAETLGSLAFKMVQVRQLRNKRNVEAEIAGW
ncbi:hypothetical protein F511_37217 [Dorcoceras hygrometricum]|uniref:Uncharacterized protein n=1 Tax=Dorcoceras hygrometricum TaxID=472368 RepID=A0A2Z7CA08_9LAMI|nr:hypothetical protein F511_37217 [Dorcoceras hygrometricum]